METKNQNKHTGKFGLGVIIGGFSLAVFFAWSSGTVRGQVYDPIHDAIIGIDIPDTSDFDAQEIADLNRQIEEKRREIDSIASQSDTYRQQIAQFETQLEGIEAQISLIDNELALLDLDIQSQQVEVEKNDLEIRTLQIEIEGQTERINVQKEQLAEYLRILDKDNRTSTLSLMLTYENFSDFFDAYQATATVTENIQGSLGSLLKLRTELENKQREFQDRRDEAERNKLELEIKAQAQQGLRGAQSQHLLKTQSSQNEIEELLARSAQQEQSAFSIIQEIEESILRNLSGGNINFEFHGFIWPTRGVITSGYGPGHHAIDIGVPQGTTVLAPAAGTVASIKCFSSPTPEACLSQLIIDHHNGFLSVYLHMNSFTVGLEEIVRQGEVIGYSGGLPYTWGAGIYCSAGLRLRSSCHTTGAHLHFELRKDGFYVNPIQYLP